MAINITTDTDNNKIPDAVENLKLGSTQEQFLTTTKEALVNLYQKNVSQDTTVAEIEQDITDLQIALQGKTKSVTYKNLDALVDKTNGLPKLGNTDLKRGDSVFILDTHSPDFWVSEIATTANNDYDIETKISELQNIGDEATVQVGWFILGKLETQKVDIEGVIKSDSAIKENELLIGIGSDDTNNESYNVKGVKLGENLNLTNNADGTITLSATDTNTTYDVVNKDNNGKNGLMSVADKKKLDKFDEDTNGYLIYNEKPVVHTISINDGEPISPTNGNIKLLIENTGGGDGKVQDVKVNGETVLDTDGNANINIRVNNEHVNVEDDTTNNTKYVNIEAVTDVQVINKGVKASVVDNGIATIDLSDIDVEELKAEIKPVTTLYNYPSDDKVDYKAIKMPNTSVVIEVLKKENNDYLSVVTQSVVVGADIYYLLDKSATGDYYYREVGGNAVNGGNEPTSVNVAFPAIYKSDFVNSSLGEFTETTTVEGYFISINNVDIPKNGDWVTIKVETVANEVVPQGSSTEGVLPPVLTLKASYDVATNTTYLKSVITVAKNVYYNVNLKSRILKGLLATTGFWVAEINNDIEALNNKVNNVENKHLYMHSIYAKTSEKVAIEGNHPSGGQEIITIELSLVTFSTTANQYANLSSALSKYCDTNGNSPLLPIQGFFTVYSSSEKVETYYTPLIRAYMNEGKLVLDFADGNAQKYSYTDDNQIIQIIQDNIITMF